MISMVTNSACMNCTKNTNGYTEASNLDIRVYSTIVVDSSDHPMAILARDHNLVYPFFTDGCDYWQHAGLIPLESRGKQHGRHVR